MSDLVLLGGVKKTACRIWGEEKQRKRWSLHMSNLCKGEVLWLWRKHFPFTGRIQTHWMQNGKTTDSKEKGLRHVGSMLHWAPAFCLELLTFPSSTLMALINASNKNLGGKNWFDLLIHLKCIQVSNDIYIYTYLPNLFIRSTKAFNSEAQPASPTSVPRNWWWKFWWGFYQPLQSMTLANASWKWWGILFQVPSKHPYAFSSFFQVPMPHLLHLS